MIDLPTTVRDGDERTTLTQMLDDQRAVVVRKAWGLSKADMTRTVGASRLTLAGIVAADESLDAELAVHSRDEVINLRWLLVHMIEETARHAGHADLLRETVDGAVGD